MDADDERLVRRINDLKQVFRLEWVGAILIALSHGQKRYRELRDEMIAWSFHDPWTGTRRSLSNGELARTLPRMVEDGLLHRTEVSGQWQPAVFYDLTEAARELLEHAGPLLLWAEAHVDFFQRAQAERGRGGIAGGEVEA